MSIQVTWLGHSTVVLDVDGTRLLTDPLLGRHAGLLRRRGEPPAREHWQNVDAVLLSHLHHDHADLRSLHLLPEGTPIVTAPPNITWLRRHGLTGISPAAGQWIGVASSPTVAVRLCPAVHRARPMPHRPNGVTGHIIRSAAGAIWFAGDTSLYADMSRIPEWAGAPIDLALVPIGGWAPRLSEGHMGPTRGGRGVRAGGCPQRRTGALGHPAHAGRPQPAARLDGPPRFRVRLRPVPRGPRVPDAQPGDRRLAARSRRRGGI